MKIITTLLLFITSIALSNCTISIGSDDIVKDERDIIGFDAIKVKDGITVELSSGEFHVMVEANDNIIEDLATELSGTTLLLYLDKNSVKNAHLKVYITAPGIRKISASASSEVKLMDVLKNSNELTFQTSSSSKISGVVDAPKINMEASSDSEIELSGHSRKLNLSASSAAEIEAENLKAEIVDASASSAAEIKTFASVELNARASSAAKILYRGGATQKVIKSSSGAVISPL